MKKTKRKMSAVTIELPDDLIAELLDFGKPNNVSVRQQIRNAFRQIALKSGSSRSYVEAGEDRYEVH